MLKTETKQQAKYLQQSTVLYFPFRTDGFPFQLLPAAANTFVFYQQSPKQNKIYQIDSKSKILSCYPMQDFQILKVIMMSPQVATVFYIDLNQVINQRNKIRITHFNLSDHSKSNLRYLLQPAFMSAPHLKYNSSQLMQQTLLRNDVNGLKLNILCFSQSQTICIVQKNRQTKVTYIHPNASEQITLYSQFEYSAKLNNQSKVGVFSRQIKQEKVFTLETTQLSKDEKQLRIVYKKYSLNFYEQKMVQKKEQACTYRVIDLWETVNEQFYIKIQAKHQRQTHYEGYIVCGVGQGSCKQLVLKAKLFHNKNNYSVHFCQPYKLAYNQSYEMQHPQKLKHFLFMNSSTYQILWQHLEVFAESKEKTSVVFPSYRQAQICLFQPQYSNPSKNTLKCRVEQLSIDYQVVSAFLLTSLTQGVDEDMVYQSLQLLSG